jgi:hypothetical protein
MVELLCVFVFFAVTAPISLILFAMTVTASLRTPEWKPSPYQPMEMLMARQKEQRAERAAAFDEGRLAA